MIEKNLQMSYISETDKGRILYDTDFVSNKILMNSLSSALRKYPDGAPIKFILKSLNMSIEEYDFILSSSLEKIKNNM